MSRRDLHWWQLEPLPLPSEAGSLPLIAACMSGLERPSLSEERGGREARGRDTAVPSASIFSRLSSEDLGTRRDGVYCCCSSSCDLGGSDCCSGREGRRCCGWANGSGDRAASAMLMGCELGGRAPTIAGEVIGMPAYPFVPPPPPLDADLWWPCRLGEGDSSDSYSERPRLLPDRCC